MLRLTLLRAAGSHQVSYKHLVFMSQPDFALLTRAAGGSRSLRDPLSPPATFPQSNLARSPARACDVDFSPTHRKALYLFLLSGLFRISPISKKSTLAGPARLMLQVKITDESTD